MVQATGDVTDTTAPAGIGGWLLVFTLLVFIGVGMGILALVGTIWSASKAANVTLVWVSPVMVSISLLFGLLIIMALLQKRRTGIRLIMILLGISVLLAAISLIIGLTSGPYAPGDVRPNVVPTVFSMVVNAAWLFYFKYSTRVKSTFVR